MAMPFRDTHLKSDVKVSTCDEFGLSGREDTTKRGTRAESLESLGNGGGDIAQGEQDTSHGGGRARREFHCRRLCAM
jgi:hypothetical protein